MNNLNNINNITYLGIRGVNRMHLRNLNDSAVSEFVGYFLVFMIATSAISLIVLWGVPAMENKKANISLESTVLQFDAIVDATNNAFSEGAFDITNGEIVNSSKVMNFQFSEGSLYIDESSERFVFYYSIYDNDLGLPFDFKVEDLKPDDRNVREFSFTVLSAPADLKLSFDFYHLTDKINSIFNDSSIIYRKNEPHFIINSFDLTGAVVINISGENLITREWGDYGRIWLFDVGSMVFQTSASNGIYKAIIENGGVMSATPGDAYYFFNEPKYWSNTYLDGNSAIDFRIIQFGMDPDGDTNYITGSNSVNIILRPVSSTVEESKIPIFSNFTMKIYGSNAVVSAWRSYYENSMGFEYDQINDVLKKVRANPTKFSLNFAKCNVIMDVKE